MEYNPLNLTFENTFQSKFEVTLKLFPDVIPPKALYYWHKLASAISWVDIKIIIKVAMLLSCLKPTYLLPYSLCVKNSVIHQPQKWKKHHFLKAYKHLSDRIC